MPNNNLETPDQQKNNPQGPQNPHKSTSPNIDSDETPQTPEKEQQAQKGLPNEIYEETLPPETRVN